MALEAAVIIVDNSGYSKNGDYAPSRLEAQIESAQYLYTTRRNANIENSTALMSNSPPTLLISLTGSDQGRYSSALSSISNNKDSEPGDLESSLALKHRQNSNQKQRIIIFLCSPLGKPIQEELIKSLKKSSISLNFISFGTESMSINRPFLQQVTDLLGETSTLTEVEPTTFSLIDVLRSQKELVATENASARGTEDFYGDVDPNLDPELALALKLSLEEEQARIARQTQNDENTNNASSDKEHETKMNIDEEDEEMARAIEMSMNQQQQ